MSRDPRATARACFALAARAGTEGEKAAALNRGMAIVTNNGLNPDEFDIPGREKARGGICPICGAFKTESHWRAPCYECSPSYADRPPVNSALANAILEAMIKQMAAGGYSTPFADAAFGRRETAAQKAERQREETMSEYVRRTGS